MKNSKKLLLLAILSLAMCFTLAHASEGITVSDVTYGVSGGTASYTATVTNSQSEAITPAVIIVYYENKVLTALNIQKTALEPGASATLTASVPADESEITDYTRITGFVVNDMKLNIPVSVDTIEKLGSRDTGIKALSVAGLTDDRVKIDEENKTVSLYLPFYDREGNSVKFDAADTQITLVNERTSVEVVDSTVSFEGEGSVKTATLNYDTKKQFKVTAEEGNSDVYDVKVFKMVKEDFEDETPILEATGNEIGVGTTTVYKGIGDKASSYLEVRSTGVVEGYGSGLTAGYGEGRDSDNGFWLSKTTHNNAQADTGSLRFVFGNVEGTSNTQTVEFDIKYEYVGDDSVEDLYKNFFVAGLEIRKSGGGALIYRLGGNSLKYSATASPKFYVGNNVGKITISSMNGNLLQWHRVKVEFYKDDQGGRHSKLYIDGEHIAEADDIMEVTDTDAGHFSICLSTRRCAKLYIDNIEFCHSVDDLKSEGEAAVSGAEEFTAELMALNDLSFTPAISPEGEITVTGFGNTGKVFAALTKVEAADSDVDLDAFSKEDFIAIDAAGTKADGSFSFNWKLPDGSSNGYYAFVVGNTDIDSAQPERTIITYYASIAEVEEALSKINSATEATMASVLEDSKLVLQISALLADSTYKKYTDDIIATLINDNKDGFATAEALREALVAATGVHALANADAESLESVLTVYSDELGLDMTAYSKIPEAVARCFETVGKEYSKSNDHTAESIVKLFDTAVALAEVNTANRGDVIKLIEDSYDFFGIDTSELSDSEKNAVAKKIAVTDVDDEYMTVDELSGAFDKAVKSLDDGKGGSNNSSNVSSRPSTKPSAGSNTITGTGNTKTEVTISESITPDVPEFTDLHLAPWAEGYITCLAESGIVNGKAEGIFAPNDPVTREEFAKMVTVAVGADGKAELSFSDVDGSAWYAPYISAALSAQIVNGYEDGTFGVGRNISREEAAVMIYRAAALIHSELPSGRYGFADSDAISEWAQEAIASCVTLGIINGNNKNEFLPRDAITRAECAKIIYCLIRTE